MPVDVELKVILQCRIADVEGRIGHDLPVSRYEVELGIDAGNEFLEGYGAVEYADRRDVKGDLLPFEIQESGICPGQAPVRGWRFHDAGVS